MVKHINFELDFEADEGYYWNIIYGDIHTNFFYVENLNDNVFRRIINLWKRDPEGLFFPSPRTVCDPIKLIDLDPNVALFYKNCGEDKTIYLCNSDKSAFSSLRITFDINDEVTFLNNLEMAAAKVDTHKK